MKKTLFALFSAVLLTAPTAFAAVNGGVNCAACTVLVGLAEQTSQLQAVPITKALSKVCSLLPSPLDYTCSTLIAWYGPNLIKMLEDKYTPDVVCSTIGMCTNENGRYCNVFPAPKAATGRRLLQSELDKEIEALKIKYNFKNYKFNVCDWIPNICNIGEHKPVFDSDGDLCANYGPLRGHNWRGRDCDDNHNSIFPGRFDYDIGADNNCNGIFGVDPVTNVPYEKQFCEGTGQMGVAILGDSATAHFRIPPNYFVASNLTYNTFKHLITNLENELDFPMLSWSTGHTPVSDYDPDVEGPIDSIYMRLRENNLCNNNDFQNIGVNGADSSSLRNNLSKILSRDKRISPLPQKPLLLYMAMIGNDVCSSRTKSRNTPEQYHDNVLATVLDLDANVPAGTKMVLIGLVDGRILYNSMHDKIHPLGSTNKDVTYEAFYDYLNCLEVSPCSGWMNSNETIRNATSATAKAMRDKLPHIVEKTRGKLQNIELFYLGDVIDDALNAYLANGGHGSDLIEPADGFHPNQLGQFMLAQYIWNATVSAGIIPPANPNNDKIRQIFFPNEIKVSTPIA